MQANSPRNKSIASAPANKAADPADAPAPAQTVERPACSTCGYFDGRYGKCRRSPAPHDRMPDEWCGEHQDFPDYLASLKAK